MKRGITGLQISVRPVVLNHMANPEHLMLVQQSEESWNKWRSTNPDVQPDLSGATLTWADLYMKDLHNANLENASLYKADMFGADLEGAILIDADLTEARLTLANLCNAELIGARLYRACLEEALLMGSHLSASHLLEAKLPDDAVRAAIIEPEPGQTDTSDAEIGDPNPEHLEMLGRGVSAWNQWRSENPELIPDLRRADLSEMQLEGIDLRKAILTGANLRGANLRGALLSFAELGWANLSDAKLEGTNCVFTKFQCANLREASLQQACLLNTRMQRANLTWAYLQGAYIRDSNLNFVNLMGTSLESAVFAKVDLRGAILYRCRVYGAAVWDVDLEGAFQRKLLASSSDEARLELDDLEMAQFIHMLMSRQKLRNVITTMGEKAVLILGRFTERKELLDRIADQLRSAGFLPMIFDFERPTDRDLTETVKVLAGLSRFIIADITNPRSVPLELQATVPDYMVPFVTIVERGQPVFGMFEDLPRKYGWALPLLEYDSADELVEAFNEVIVEPALVKADEIRAQKAAAPVRRSIQRR